MIRNLRNRVERLEQSSAVPDQEPIRYAKLLSFGLVAPDRLTPSECEELEFWMQTLEVDRIKALESDPMGVRYRCELTRLGLPQPATLAGIDVIAEAIRLTGMPDPGPAARAT